MRGMKGFTLIELLVVLIILGILAAIAVPKFMAATENARVAEATRALGTIREAEEAYNQLNSTYTSNILLLGVNASGVVSIDSTHLEVKYWNITLANTGTAFNALATRKDVPSGTTYSTNTIYLNEGGAWGGTHTLRPSQNP